MLCSEVLLGYAATPTLLQVLSETPCKSICETGMAGHREMGTAF